MMLLGCCLVDLVDTGRLVLMVRLALKRRAELIATSARVVLLSQAPYTLAQPQSASLILQESPGTVEA